jgi:hypothetical protein
VAAVIATTALTLLAAACGSGSAGSPSAGGSSGSPSAVAYSACVRSHGVPNFPDPDSSSGAVLKADPQQLGVSSSQLQAAQQDCRHLIPNTGSTADQQQETQCATAGDCSPAVVQKWMNGLRTLAGCLRTHGEPNWPDPIISSQGRNEGLPHFDYAAAGIDHHSSQVLANVDECIRLTGFDGLPLP